MNNVITPAIIKNFHPQAWNRWFNRPGKKHFEPEQRAWYIDIEQDGCECTILENAGEGMWLVQFDYSNDTMEVPDEFLYPMRGEDNGNETA